MIDSIRYFEEVCINRIEELETEFIRNPQKIAEYVTGITEELQNVGLRMIQESLESMNQMIIEDPKRKKTWVIERHDPKQIITSLGPVRYTKTLFKNKVTGRSEYLLDRIVGFIRDQRMTEDAEAKLLAEAVQSSYRRGGEAVSLLTDVSKQTVKNKIHGLEFPECSKPESKRTVKYLYIEADEDHVSLQYQDHKGDLQENENHQKNNCLLTKLVYVHEGIAPDSPRSKRHHLIRPYYFCSTSLLEDNRQFWGRIYRYLESNYDLDKVEKIYLNADGGGWIKAGMREISGITCVLDEFHLEKYLTKITSHMLDSEYDARRELRRIIRNGTKQEFKEAVENIQEYLRDETGIKRIQEASQYILSNWTPARLRLKHRDGVVGSSTEGHVSHVLSSRMSSRPMGWSKLGATKMSQLRAYHMNGGNMLELVRYQKQKLPKVSGLEYKTISSVQIRKSERNRHGETGKYSDSFHYELSDYGKKLMYFRNHIWNL